MKYNHIKSFSYLIILIFAATSAQASGWQKAVKCADKKVQKKYYAAAADIYEHVLNYKQSRKDSINADSLNSIRVKLADCYMKTGNTIKAESNYAEVVKAGKSDAQTTFSYGRALQANSKYTDAKAQFDKVSNDASIKAKMAKGFSETSDKAEGSKHKNAFNIQRAGFNTSASEYAPAYYRKGLVYTSNRAERGLASHRLMWNKEPFTDIYIVQEDGKGDLIKTDKLPAAINSKLNDGTATFNAAYDEVFFTRNNAKNKKHDQLQLFSSHLNGTEWSTPKVLNFVMEGANYAHPSLSPDGNTLYFSSDVAGQGFGGMDLYAARRNGSVWETPVNLGAGINSAGNDVFPFAAADSSLYFTSDGWPGYGGLDVFQSKQENGKFGKVENLGAEFNSNKDDLTAIVDSRNRIGYFASNRDGDDDIFSFSLPVSKEEKKDQPLHSLTLIDRGSNQPITGARVEVADPRNPAEGAFYYTNDKGIFYYDKKIKPEDDVKIAKDDFKPLTVKGSTLSDVKTFDVQMEAISRPVKADAQHPYTTILYYELNTSNLATSSKDTLREIVEMMKNPQNIVYVSGYADQRGSDTYNNGLSLRRVKEVVDYLAAQGIETIRIRSAYFGAVKLSNECRRDPKCVDQTNRLNRRVEIKVGNQ